jgi:hypothetical protein
MTWVPDGHGHPDPSADLMAVKREHLEHVHGVPMMSLWAPSLWPFLHAKLHEGAWGFNPYTDVPRERTPIYDALLAEWRGPAQLSQLF